MGTCSSLKNTVLNNKSVGRKTERIKFYTSNQLNVDHRTYRPEKFGRESEVDALSIDDHLGDDTKVDFIKMDIQGFEMQAILGMQKTL